LHNTGYETYVVQFVVAEAQGFKWRVAGLPPQEANMSHDHHGLE